MIPRISAGVDFLDSFLSKGYEKDIVTTFYGPAGSGKTLLCILASLSVDKKVIFIDTEGGFSVERLKQICSGYEDVMKRIVFFKPMSFKEQKDAFEKLKDVVDDKVGLIIVDSISMLYRLELGKNEEVYEINRELGKQIGYLSEIARKHSIPVILTNQVYADFDNKDQVKMVGGDILKYGSKCLIELKKYKGSVRQIMLRKHRSLPDGKNLFFEIVEEGVRKKVV